MTVPELLSNIEAAGGALVLAGDRIRCRLPEDAAPLLRELRAHRDEVLRVLRERETIPAMPPRVRLIAWNPKQPPVIVERWSVVTDVILFARSTLEQLRLALAGNSWLAGNWSVPELVDRLEEVGVRVCVEGEAAAAMIPGLRENRAKSSNQRRRSL